MNTYLSINITDNDITDIAVEHGIDVALATKRVVEWAKYIQETASSLVLDQVEAVILHDQP